LPRKRGAVARGQEESVPEREKGGSGGVDGVEAEGPDGRECMTGRKKNADMAMYGMSIDSGC
jgi:hypothetical protein